MGEVAPSWLVFTITAGHHTSRRILRCTGCQCVPGPLKGWQPPVCYPGTSPAAGPATGHLPPALHWLQQLLTAGYRLGAEGCGSGITFWLLLKWLSRLWLHPPALCIWNVTEVGTRPSAIFFVDCLLKSPRFRILAEVMVSVLHTIILQKVSSKPAHPPPRQLKLWHLWPLWNLCPSSFLGQKLEDQERTLKINSFSSSSSFSIRSLLSCDVSVLFMSICLLVSTKKK